MKQVSHGAAGSYKYYSVDYTILHSVDKGIAGKWHNQIVTINQKTNISRSLKGHSVVV